MHAKIQWIDNAGFEAHADSGHKIVVDGPPDSGGQNRGARPMELLLMGLGGCTSFDVVNILTKSRQDIADVVTELTATRATGVPQVFETIQIHFKVTGNNLDPKKVARAVALSAEKYCSASIMLERGGVAIDHSHEIIQT
jgi:putative redox protein